MAPDPRSSSFRDVLVLFTQTQAGLGHLRVTDALRHGMPHEIASTVLHSLDKTVTVTHAIASRHIILRRLSDWIQRGWAEQAFTVLYRRYLTHHTDTVWKQMTTLLESQATKPRTLLLVATHFGLAHQLGALKARLANVYGVRVLLVVVVTDDTAIKLWAVEHADSIIAPSSTTARKLASYHKASGFTNNTQYIRLPYMVSQRLAVPLSPPEYASRVAQVRNDGVVPTIIAIPISGAAVQLSYFDELLADLRTSGFASRVHLVSLKMPATKDFLGRVMGEEHISVAVSPLPGEVVELYEQVYEQEVIALEVTKPSEQAFKCLLSPRRRGGAILLFSEPVGRQEEDNVWFMDRHDLIPPRGLQQAMWEASEKRTPATDEMRTRAGKWRGVQLPTCPHKSARFIAWCKREGIFTAMVHFGAYAKDPALAPNGVAQFWEKMEEIIRV